MQRKRFEETKAEGKGGRLTEEYERTIVRRLAQKAIADIAETTSLRRDLDVDVIAAKTRVKAVVEAWSGEDVADMLCTLTSLRQYHPGFTAIKGKAMLRMNINSLSSIGITAFQDQRRIWAAVSEFQEFCNNLEWTSPDYRSSL